MYRKIYLWKSFSTIFSTVIRYWTKLKVEFGQLVYLLCNRINCDDFVIFFFNVNLHIFHVRERLANACCHTRLYKWECNTAKICNYESDLLPLFKFIASTLDIEKKIKSNQIKKKVEIYYFIFSVHIFQFCNL